MLTALAERWRDALEFFEEMIEERFHHGEPLSFAATHFGRFWHLKKKQPYELLQLRVGEKYRKIFQGVISLQGNPCGPPCPKPAALLARDAGPL